MPKLVHHAIKLPPQQAPAHALFKSWSTFAEAHGLHAGKLQTLSDELAKRSELKRIKDTLGIRVRATPATLYWSDERA